jgi:hypothetical protein
MTDDTIPLFAFPAVQGKKITAAFDGGRMSSDGGVMLLSLAFAAACPNADLFASLPAALMPSGP